jgi:hypothetical protein
MKDEQIESLVVEFGPSEEREKKEEIAKLESQLASVKKTACVG